jgi:hypothetical protein
MALLFHDLPQRQHLKSYSATHSYHSQQTHEWSQRAYKGLLTNSTPGGIVTLNLGVYEPIVDPKGRPILVQVILLM